MDNNNEQLFFLKEEKKNIYMRVFIYLLHIATGGGGKGNKAKAAIGYTVSHFAR